jgi:hypothetical protein
VIDVLDWEKIVGTAGASGTVAANTLNSYYEYELSPMSLTAVTLK